MARLSRVALSMGLLIAALLALELRSRGEAVPIRKALDTFPVAVGDWQGRESALLDVETLNTLRVTDYMMRRYSDATGRSLWLYIAYWDTQRRGAQVHNPKYCLPGSGWEPLESSYLTVALPPPYPSLTVNRYVIQKEREQQVVLYWYHSQGQAIAGEVAARVALVRNSIQRNRTDGALIRVSSPIYENVPETSSRLARYVQAVYPALGEYLPD